VSRWPSGFCAALLLWVAACEEGRSVRPGGRSNPTQDAAEGTDAVTSGEDAAEVDGEVQQDAGVDPADGGDNFDAAPPTDGGVLDLGFPDPPDAGFPDAFVPPPSDAGFPDAGFASGCGTAQNPGVYNASITVSGQQRNLVLVVPSGYDPNRRYPIAFGFHGSSWLGSSYRNSILDIEQAANNGAIFVYPDGLVVGGGQTGWDLSPSGYDVRFFDALLGGIAAQYCLDMSRVFAFGTSYGGYFSNTLGCTRPGVLRGVASVSGGGPSFSCAGTTSWFGSHSQDDNVVGYSNGTRSRDIWRGLNQCSATTTPSTPSPCVSYDGCAAGRRVEWCGLPNGQHNQPSWVGSAIWSFFSRL
jgi:poly(3-hydroxybutyrate) depolymerase